MGPNGRQDGRHYNRIYYFFNNRKKSTSKGPMYVFVNKRVIVGDLRNNGATIIPFKPIWHRKLLQNGLQDGCQDMTITYFFLIIEYKMCDRWLYLSLVLGL